eukprot:sb/3479258/
MTSRQQGKQLGPRQLGKLPPGWESQRWFHNLGRSSPGCTPISLRKDIQTRKGRARLHGGGLRERETKRDRERQRETERQMGRQRGGRLTYISLI